MYSETGCIPLALALLLATVLVDWLIKDILEYQDSKKDKDKER